MQKFSFNIILFFVVLSYSTLSFAHSRGESYSSWQFSKDRSVDLTYTLKLRDIDQLGEAFQINQAGWQQRIALYLDQKVFINTANKPCESNTGFSFHTAKTYLQLNKVFHCESNESLVIEHHGLFDIDQAHMHIARVKLEDGKLLEKIFLARDRVWQISSQPKSVWQTAFDYGVLGAEHIVFGWDHLAFLASLGLLMLSLGKSIKLFVLLITGFTLGHSLSLITTVFGMVHTNTTVVEALIAASIALIAYECVAIKQKAQLGFSLTIGALLVFFIFLTQVWINTALPLQVLFGLTLFALCYLNFSRVSTSFTLHLLITFLFGLIHGFGFAASLLDIGLPQQALITALFSFNLGVEFGQLLVLLCALLLIKLLATTQLKQYQNAGFDFAAASLFGLGCFWFIERSLI